MPAGPDPRASRPDRSRHGSCAGRRSRKACGWRANACRRAGPGRGACVGLNRTRSPPCMRCRGPCLASPPRSASCLAFPVPRAARQSQEPARGSGFPAPPTSRSCLRAVPVSNGESISTASARDRASPLPHIFRVFRCPHAVHRIWLVIRIQRPFSTALYTGHPQVTRRNAGNTGWPALPPHRIHWLYNSISRPRRCVAIHQGCVPMSAAKGRLAAAAVDVAWGKQFATRWSGA